MLVNGFENRQKPKRRNNLIHMEVIRKDSAAAISKL